MKVVDEEPKRRGENNSVTATVAEWAQVSLESGRSIILSHGVDYHSSDNAIKTTMYMYAKENNLTVVTNSKGRGRILIRFYRKDEDL